MSASPCHVCGASPSSPYSDAMSPLNLPPAQSDHKGDDFGSYTQSRRLDGLHRRIITPTPYIRWQTWQSQRAALEQELFELGATQDAPDQQRIVQLKQQDLRRVELQIRELERAIKEFETLRAQV